MPSPVALETDDRSFWEPKGYLSVSRRTSNGYALCDQYRQMVEELESAITSYTKNLDNWSLTWKSKIGRNDSVPIFSFIDLALFGSFKKDFYKRRLSPC